MSSPLQPAQPPQVGQRFERTGPNPRPATNPATFARLLASTLEQSRRFPSVGQPAAESWSENSQGGGQEVLGLLSQYGITPSSTEFGSRPGASGAAPFGVGTAGGGLFGAPGLNSLEQGRLRELLGRLSIPNGGQELLSGSTESGPLSPARGRVREGGSFPSQGPAGATRPPTPTTYDGLINEAARRYRVDPALVAGVIEAESGFNPRALSPAGAKGLMQLMDGTAQGLGVRDAFDPSDNVNGGAKLLRQLLDRYHENVPLALAAYNAGPGAVDRYGGIPPYRETQTYVPRVLAATERYRSREQALTGGRGAPWM